MKLKVLWAVLFVQGLLMILNKIEISRYISDLNGVCAAGIILSSVSGVGLLLEMYGKRNGD